MTPDDLTAAMVAPAETLAIIVHNDGTARQVADVTDRMTREELVALAVVLAAATVPGRTMAQALAWTDVPARPERKRGELAPHGTHAAYNRHRKNGTEPCDDCRRAENDYSAERKRAATVRKAWAA